MTESAKAAEPLPVMDLSTGICGIPLSGPVLNGSGTFDALAARRVFGDALIEDRRHPDETQAFYARHLDRK
nr:hypothetical protein [Solirubrobacterales bacterium]